MIWRWKYFKPEEVLSPVGLLEYLRGNLLLQPEALDYLEAFRSIVGVPLLCNTGGLKFRGYRSYDENKLIGGARLSRHPQGIAFDLTPGQGALSSLLEAAKKFSNFGAIGYYPDNNFIHVDTRPRFNGEPRIWIN